METYTKVKDFVPNPHYLEQRQASLNTLDFNTIDPPIVQVMRDFARLPYCFTLQSCHGHFLYDHQRNPKNIAPIPISEHIEHVDYRIAYIALCIQNSGLGEKLFHELKKIPLIDQAYIQFGCAEWFWKRLVNSYVLQVQPDRFKTKDRFRVSYQEALHIQEVRDRFYRRLGALVSELSKTGSG